MSDEPVQTRTCPTCGNTVPAMARYCPSCGTRLNPAEQFTAADFEDALADVLDAPQDEPTVRQAARPPTADEPAVVLPPVSMPPTVPQTEWTAQSSDWVSPSGEPGTWTAQRPTAVIEVKSRGNRKLWIFLAILGFLVFCCCGGFFALLAISERGTAFQQDISTFALLWTS